MIQYLFSLTKQLKNPLRLACLLIGIWILSQTAFGTFKDELVINNVFFILSGLVWIFLAFKKPAQAT